MNPVLRAFPFLIVSQLALIMGGVGWLTLRPPVEGAMLVIPLSDGARAALPQNVIDRGGQLVRMGSIPGSFVVHGRRDSLAQPGMLLIAADDTGCGNVAENNR